MSGDGDGVHVKGINFVQILRLHDNPCGLVSFEYWPC